MKKLYGLLFALVIIGSPLMGSAELIQSNSPIEQSPIIEEKSSNIDIDTALDIATLANMATIMLVMLPNIYNSIKPNILPIVPNIFNPWHSPLCSLGPIKFTPFSIAALTLATVKSYRSKGFRYALKEGTKSLVSMTIYNMIPDNLLQSACGCISYMPGIASIQKFMGNHITTTAIANCFIKSEIIMPKIMSLPSDIISYFTGPKPNQMIFVKDGVENVIIDVDSSEESINKMTALILNGYKAAVLPE